MQSTALAGTQLVLPTPNTQQKGSALSLHSLDKQSTSIYFHICNWTQGSSYGDHDKPSDKQSESGYSEHLDPL